MPRGIFEKMKGRSECGRAFDLLDGGNLSPLSRREAGDVVRAN